MSTVPRFSSVDGAPRALDDSRRAESQRAWPPAPDGPPRPGRRRGTDHGRDEHRRRRARRPRPGRRRATGGAVPGGGLAVPAAALVLVALCLRGPFAAVGPLLDELGDELSLSTGALAVVAALPLVCFGLLSPLAPVLAARIGLHRAALAATAVLRLGVLLRLGGAAGALRRHGAAHRRHRGRERAAAGAGARRVRHPERRRPRGDHGVHGVLRQPRRGLRPADQRPHRQRRPRAGAVGGARSWPRCSAWRCWPAARPERPAPRARPRTAHRDPARPRGARRDGRSSASSPCPSTGC